MKREKDFIENGDRYRFDGGECSAKNGYAQIDTKQDAWYYGQWANPSKLRIVAYVEGDVIRQQAESPEEFVEALYKLRDFHNEYDQFLGIDCMLNPDIKAEFEKLGLGELLH